jgi:hypothetical protein
LSHGVPAAPYVIVMHVPAPPAVEVTHVVPGTQRPPGALVTWPQGCPAAMGAAHVPHDELPWKLQSALWHWVPETHVAPPPKVPAGAMHALVVLDTNARQSASSADAQESRNPGPSVAPGSARSSPHAFSKRGCSFA